MLSSDEVLEIFNSDWGRKTVFNYYVKPYFRKFGLQIEQVPQDLLEAKYQYYLTYQFIKNETRNQICKGRMQKHN